MNFLEWLFGTNDSEVVIIDGYFTDLVDIPTTEFEKCQSAMFDSLAENGKNGKKKNSRPSGMQVL